VNVENIGKTEARVREQCGKNAPNCGNSAGALKTGDRVEMVEDAPRFGRGGTTGVVTNDGTGGGRRLAPGSIRVTRDGHSNPETWWAGFWRRIPKECP